MRGKWLLVAGTTILLAIAAGAWSVYRQGAPRKPAPRVAAVPKLPVYQGSDVSLTGKIEPRKIVPVAAPMDGIVDAVFAEAGQEVVQGQLLARVKSGRLDAILEDANGQAEHAQTRLSDIEASIIAARLESSRANADLARARSDFERADKVYQRQSLLMKEGATPRLVFEKAQRDYETAKQNFENKSALAQQSDGRLESLTKEREAARRVLNEKNLLLDQAKADVSSGDVASPVDGVVIARHAQPGEEVSPTMTDFFEIAVDLGSLAVTLDPPPPVLARIHPGQQVVVHVAEYPEDLPGSVREIRGTQVIVDFNSPSQAIKPGLTANVRIILS
jgi:multidrug resistance efflux pump